MPAPLFILFSALVLIFAVAVVANRNPVTAALCLVVSFVGLAALFIGLSAFFIGIVQILVYAGAVMVLFLFIIMLMDIEEEQKKHFDRIRTTGGIAVGLGMAFLIGGVLWDYEDGETTLGDVPVQFETAVNLREAEAGSGSGVVRSANATAALREGRLKDVALVGEKLFNDYNLHLQMIAVLILIATVGVVALGKKDQPRAPVVSGDAEESSESAEPTA